MGRLHAGRVHLCLSLHQIRIVRNRNRGQFAPAPVPGMRHVTDRVFGHVIFLLSFQLFLVRLCLQIWDRFDDLCPQSFGLHLTLDFVQRNWLDARPQMRNDLVQLFLIFLHPLVRQVDPSYVFKLLQSLLGL